jgi:hypothetical protein
MSAPLPSTGKPSPVVDGISVPAGRPGRAGRVRGDPASPPAFGGAPPFVSDADVMARLALLGEQVEFALSEIALRRAALRRVCEEEFPGARWLPGPIETLANPRIARALAGELAAVHRLRWWAQELYGLQDMAATRFPPPPPRSHLPGWY